MPGLFEQFPHTNLHELNLDWLINMINQFKEELKNSAVLSVNGETGHVTLYESENVILPALPSGVDQWRLVRLMDGQYVGILFYNGHAYIQRGNENMRLLTLEDIPTSSGVVSWNGLTGVVNVTGQNIPVDDTADADSIDQAITTEHTERVNADNALSNSINATNQAITTLNSKITNMVIEFGTSSKELTQNLTDNWRTAVPNDSRVYFVRIVCIYGDFYGVICRYSDVYGTGVVSRYDGRVYRIQMDNGSCSSYQLQNRLIQVLSTGSKTISGNGNIVYTFSHKVLVLGAYCTSSDIVCSAYPASSADSSGSAEWWIHCRNANSSGSVASGTITCYIIYIDMA